MKFTTAIAAAVIGISSVSALPTKDMPTAQELIPQEISIYHVWTGQIEFQFSEGRISKTQNSSDLTTLATFDFTKIPSASGRTCKLVFETNNKYVIEGTPQFDVFEADHIVTTDQATWPKSSVRQRQLGRLEAVKGGNAKEVFAIQGFTFPCPTEKRAYEFVPTGEKSTITWDEATDGAYVQWW